MSLTLPAELAPVLELVGCTWPEADEDGLRQAAHAWRNLGSEVERLHGRVSGAVRRVTAENSGPAVDAFEAASRPYAGGSGHLADARSAAELMAGALESAAVSTELCKAAIKSRLATLKAETGTTAPGSGTSPDAAVDSAVQAAGQVIRQLLDQLRKDLAETLENALAEPAVKSLQTLAARGGAAAGTGGAAGTVTDGLPGAGAGVAGQGGPGGGLPGVGSDSAGGAAAGAGLPGGPVTGAAGAAAGVAGTGGAVDAVRGEGHGHGYGGTDQAAGGTAAGDHDGRGGPGDGAAGALPGADGDDPEGRRLRMQAAFDGGTATTAVDGLPQGLGRGDGGGAGVQTAAAASGVGLAGSHGVSPDAAAGQSGAHHHGHGTLDPQTDVSAQLLSQTDQYGSHGDHQQPDGSTTLAGTAATAGTGGNDNPFDDLPEMPEAEDEDEEAPARGLTGTTAGGVAGGGNTSGGRPAAMDLRDTGSGPVMGTATAGSSGVVGGEAAGGTASGLRPAPARDGGALGAAGAARTVTTAAPEATPGLPGSSAPAEDGGAVTEGSASAGGRAGDLSSGGPGGGSVGGGAVSVGGRGAGERSPVGGLTVGPGSTGGLPGVDAPGGSVGGRGGGSGPGLIGSGSSPGQGVVGGSAGGTGPAGAVTGGPAGGAGGGERGPVGGPVTVGGGGGAGDGSAGGPGSGLIGSGSSAGQGAARAGRTAGSAGVAEPARPGAGGPGGAVGGPVGAAVPPPAAGGAAPATAPAADGAYALAVVHTARAVRQGSAAGQQPRGDLGGPADGRPYGRPGGLVPVPEECRRALEEAFPRDPQGRPVRHPDPYVGGWADAVNDGGHRRPGRAVNCLDVALSGVDSYAGHPCCAAARIPEGPGADRGEYGGRDRAEHRLGAVFREVGDGPSAFTRVEEELRGAGHGSQAVLLTRDDAGRAHAWNAVNHDGRIVHLDFQTGRRGPEPLHPGDHGVWAVVLGPDRRPLEDGPDRSGTPRPGEADRTVLRGVHWARRVDTRDVVDHLAAPRPVEASGTPDRGRRGALLAALAWLSPPDAPDHPAPAPPAVVPDGPGLERPGSGSGRPGAGEDPAPPAARRGLAAALHDPGRDRPDFSRGLAVLEVCGPGGEGVVYVDRPAGADQVASQGPAARAVSPYRLRRVSTEREPYDDTAAVEGGEDEGSAVGGAGLESLWRALDGR